MAKNKTAASHSPLIAKYQKTLETDPSSRVFAPLAECYRKIGMLDEALTVLKRGIKQHPSYTLGLLGVAFCYYDLEQYELTYSTLHPLVETNRDNLRLQKLFAQTCHHLGNDDEALETYKYLLFVNPRDKQAAKFVGQLEGAKDAASETPIVFNKKESPSKNIESFSVDSLEVSPDSEFDDWIQVDLPETEQIEKKEEASSSEINFEDWEKNTKKQAPKHQDRDDSAPVITHTLVDLYCAQGHPQRALEVLENILALNPDDKKTLLKMEEVRKLLKETSTIDEEPVGEESGGEGHQQLMKFYDSKLEDIQGSTRNQLEDKLWLFYSKIQQRAKEVRALEK